LAEFGDIFDYQMSALAYEYVTFGIVTVYALVFAWGLLRSNDRSFEALSAV